MSHTFKGDIPVDFLTELNHRLTREFNQHRDAYLRGERRLSNPKRDQPMHFKARAIKKVAPVPGSRNYSFVLYKIPFATYLGRDFSDKKKLLDAWAAGRLPMQGCALVLDKGKVFLKAVFGQPVCADPKASAIAEVSLSLECPMQVIIGKQQYKIGSRDEFLHRRLSIKAARQRVQASVSGARSDKGLKRKTKANKSYATMEKDFVNYQLHVYSRRLIDLCSRKGVSTILLVNQQQKEEEAKGDKFLLQNWSYFDLKRKIEYKAAKKGITVIVE